MLRLPLWLPALLLAAAAAAPAATVTVLRAEFGRFEVQASGALEFRPGTAVPFAVDQAYGWVITLAKPPPQVKVREELTLPAAPATWGDPEPGIKRTVSADGRTAITELTLEVHGGMISQAWSVAPGDPKGEYVMKVWVEDGPPAMFRFQVR